MSRIRRHAVTFLHLMLLSACVPGLGSPSPEATIEAPTEIPSPTATIPSPTETPSPTATLPAPTAAPAAESDTAASGSCWLVAIDEIVVYQRPSLDGAVFATLPAGDQVIVSGITEDGWIGFDPGVAQAANVGPFRLRWVQDENGALTLEGMCDDLPIVVGPPAGVCFTMSMFDIPVYAGADPSTEVIATMRPGDYAEVKGRTADNWIEVDLSVGSMELDLVGWIEGEAVNFNGPCDDLPIVAP
jgi:hypothetical protein